MKFFVQNRITVSPFYSILQHFISSRMRYYKIYKKCSKKDLEYFAFLGHFGTTFCCNQVESLFLKPTPNGATATCPYIGSDSQLGCLGFPQILDLISVHYGSKLHYQNFICWVLNSIFDNFVWLPPSVLAEKGAAAIKSWISLGLGLILYFFISIFLCRWLFWWLTQSTQLTKHLKVSWDWAQISVRGPQFINAGSICVCVCVCVSSLLNLQMEF